MKTKLLALLVLTASALSASAALISQWTFEVNTPPDLTDSTTQTTAADIGSGIGTGVHTSALTDWSTPAGNGSANSWSATNWGIGDFWQFQVSAVGFAGISLSWDQTSSNTGPRDFGLFYSNDGTLFTQFGANYIVLANGTPNPAWSSGTPQPAYNFTRDLSSITALNGDSSIFFRLVDMSAISAIGGDVGATGTSRIDNFTVNGNVTSQVPESSPGWLGLACLVALVGFAGNRAILQRVP